jgi:hypothetical protein
MHQIVYALEVVGGIAFFLVLGVWILGVATEFFTGVRPKWGLLLWGLFHRKELEEASRCGCDKGEPVWLMVAGSGGDPIGWVCFQCGRWATPSEAATITRGDMAGSTENPVQLGGA